MKNIKFILSVTAILIALCVSVLAQNQAKPSSRILLVPLDDRPPCLQMPVRLGAVADVEVVTPPRELLGKFTTSGQSNKIIAWLKTLDLKQFDAAVVSLDMLAYGGLVAMREHGATSRETAQQRINFLREMKRRAPRLPIYGSSVIMRLAPTGNVINEAYRAKLARWAEIVSETGDEKLQAEAKKLEKEIPAAVLTDYKRARERDLAGNFQALELARQNIFDYLILSQDDAHPTGVHVAEREKLIAEVKRLGLSDKVPVQPGADEVSMLLMARFVRSKYESAPHIMPVYSSETTRTAVMPFEDRKLHETVSYHIKAVGGQEIADEESSDLLFYVFASRFEPGKAKAFAGEIEEKLKQNKRVIVVDVDPSAKTEGADPTFADELKRRGIFRHLSGYAAWNTAGNMIGTALPQAVMFEGARQQIREQQQQQPDATDFSETSRKITEAQEWFLLHRWLDDYVYNSLVRPEIRKYAAEKSWNPFRFPESANQEIEKFGLELMKKHYADAVQLYAKKEQINTSLFCEPKNDLSFDLPWNRAFEAEISFGLKCESRKPFSGS